MAAVTICSNFGAQKNIISHCVHCFPIYLPWSDGTRCHDRRNIRKRGPWSLLDEMHCPERDGQGGSNMGLRTNSCLSVLCYALKSFSTLALLTLWTGLFCVVGAVLFIVGWLPVLTSIPGFWLLPADNQPCTSIHTHHVWTPKMSPAIASLGAGPVLTHLSLNSHEAGVTVIIPHGAK